MITWNIYELSSKTLILHGVKCRRRIRNFAMKNDINVLSENATDKENIVRVALISNENPDLILKYIDTEFEGTVLNLILKDISNPVLSKLKVNNGED
jgi:hypothetical protein